MFDHWPTDEEIDEFIRRAEADPVVWAALDNPGRPVGVPDLEGLEAGPRLGRVLASIDVDTVSGHDRVRVLRAHQRMVAHHQARMFEAMTAVSDTLVDDLDDIELGERAAASEIRSALRLTRRTADHQLGVAHHLGRRLPAVWKAMLEGRVDERRAAEFVSGTAHLSVAQAREVVDGLLESAGGWTWSQLRERIRTACQTVDPADAAERYDTAVDERRLVTEVSTDGTVNLLGVGLPAERAAQAADRINHIARHLETGNESRTMDQLRADVFLDLLCGTAHPQHGSVHLTVDLATLAELNEDPGELAGYGPVVSDLTRRLTHDLHQTTWSWTVTHPESGMPIADGTTRRRPTTSQTRRIHSQHPTCIFPGCRTPAIASDLDHTRPWDDGGPTSIDNLAPLCRHDHTLRHHTPWTYHPTPHGDWHWTSPLGHTHTTSGRDP